MIIYNMSKIIISNKIKMEDIVIETVAKILVSDGQSWESTDLIGNLQIIKLEKLRTHIFSMKDGKTGEELF